MKQGFLLDISVISALSPGRVAHLMSGFADWLTAHDAQLFIPCVAVAELAQGIAKLRRCGATERADRLDLWFDQLITGYGERILSLNPAMARLAGQLFDDATAKGRHPGFADVVIAAMAIQQELLLLTCNLKHFEPLGVRCQDPLTELPRP